MTRDADPDWAHQRYGFVTNDAARPVMEVFSDLQANNLMLLEDRQSSHEDVTGAF
ncbi:MAG: hypothetical protein M0Q95_19555 [Porticoccaceae bacterium]|nr:hypothetical protein [Porticoccaceae bacterium]